jgi:hypothetical protein
MGDVDKLGVIWELKLMISSSLKYVALKKALLINSLV